MNKKNEVPDLCKPKEKEKKVSRRREAASGAVITVITRGYILVLYTSAVLGFMPVLQKVLDCKHKFTQVHIPKKAINKRAFEFFKSNEFFSLLKYLSLKEELLPAFSYCFINF